MATAPLSFRKASKAQARLRCAIFGPSGSGKTYSALSIATGIGGSIGVIDTEHSSASKYADRFDFVVIDLDHPTIEQMLEAIRAAADAKIAVLILDSLSHPWQELLEEVDRITTSSRHKGNKWSAWSEGTPKQKALIQAILSYPGHLIATMRSKTEWQTEQGAGKSKPVRVGLAPEQGKGIEYEFDLLLEMSPSHAAEIIKDRTGKFQDAVIDRPGRDFGAQLGAWLNDGEATEPTLDHPTITTEQHADLVARLTAAGVEEARVAKWLRSAFTDDYGEDFTLARLQRDHLPGLLERIPMWAARILEERKDQAAALDWAADKHGWNGLTDHLAEIVQLAADDSQSYKIAASECQGVDRETYETKHKEAKARCVALLSALTQMQAKEQASQ